VNQAVKEKRAFVIGVPFQDRHHEDEPLKVLQRQYGTEFETASGLPDAAGRMVGAGSNVWARLQCVNRVLNNRSLRPGMRPRLEYSVRLNAVFEPGYKALLCFLVISRKQKREAIQAVHLLCEESAKIFHTCVLTGLNILDLISLSAVHGVVS
jgi:hypothetical protein